MRSLRPPDASIPRSLRILPYTVPLSLRGFDSVEERSLLTLAPTPLDAQDWFESFAGDVLDARGSRYLPVGRMSDGEYRFLFGRQPASPRMGWTSRAMHHVREAKYAVRHRHRFTAATLPGVSSGSYTHAERRLASSCFVDDMKYIAHRGYLALHMTFGPKPFQESYHPQLQRLLRGHGIALTAENYVPFYFPYALLASRLSSLLEGQRVAVATNASRHDKMRVGDHLRDAGAVSVRWVSVSPERALFDDLDVIGMIGAVDIALVGAGVGKLNVMRQLAPLDVPVIDAGFMLEVWKVPERAGSRPFTFT